MSYTSLTSREVQFLPVLAMFKNFACCTEKKNVKELESSGVIFEWFLRRIFNNKSPTNQKLQLSA